MATHAFKVEVRDRHVWIWQRGELVSDAEVDALQGAVRANMESLVAGRRLRAFADEDSAAAWLLG